jgi:DNA polymerase elongation subunit (family B)
MEYYFDDIECCEQIGEFEDEYVYDIEVDDNTHTFIGNDILVHNSVYLTFKPLLDSCDWRSHYKDEVEFILALRDNILDDFIHRNFSEYAKKYNTTDLQNLEMETISRSGLMMAKKKYIMDIAWKDPGVRFDPQKKIKPVGVELVQSSTPKFAREAQKDLLNLLFAEGKKLKYQKLIGKIREYKNQFKMQNPEDISLTKGIGDYEKYIIEDKDHLRLAEKCPINVRSSGVYNHELLNSKFKTKYSLLKSGDKVKYYYAKGKNDVFGFVPGNFPVEIAYEIDYDRQFEKVLVEPFNRYIEALGFNPIPGHLMYSTALF